MSTAAERDAEFEAASVALAQANERFHRARIEALRVEAPGNLERAEDLNLWLRDTFRADRERFTTLTGAQFEKFLEHGYRADIVTPFGRLYVVGDDPGWREELAAQRRDNPTLTG